MNIDEAVSMRFRTEVASFFNVLAAPAEVFAGLYHTPRYRVPALFTLVASLIAGYAMIPAEEQILRGIYMRSFGAEHADSAVTSLMKIYFVLGVLVRTCTIFVRWLVFSVVLYSITRSCIPKSYPNWKQIFCVVAYSEIIFIAMSVISVLMIYAQGLEKIVNSTDMVVFKGLDALVGSWIDNPLLSTLFANVNIFSLWYVITVSVGLRVFTGFKRSESVALTAVSWLTWSIVNMLGKPVTEYFLKFV